MTAVLNRTALPGGSYFSKFFYIPIVAITIPATIIAAQSRRYPTPFSRNTSQPQSIVTRTQDCLMSAVNSLIQSKILRTVFGRMKYPTEVFQA